MGPQAELTTSTATERVALDPRNLPQRPLPRAAFVGVAIAGTGLLVWISRHVFLFWDDFMFLGQARESGLGRAYLDNPLFTHFSPVSRLLDWLVAPLVAHHPWIILVVQSVLLAAVVAAVTWLMVVLHGRTWTALVGAGILAPSLTLVPLGSWWTAGANIMPALVGFLVAFGSMVLVVRGHSRWWAVPCLAGAVIGVLDYELPILLPGYLGLWVLLFHRRVTSARLREILARTWWLWVGLVGVAGAAAANYRLNYYGKVAEPPLGLTLHALGRSLVGTLIPSALGLHDPRTAWFATVSVVVGCVVLVGLLGWLVTSRRGTWRGIVFAAVGWLLPTLALVLNRAGIYGIAVVDDAIYFFLPTVLCLVGVLESERAPRRRSGAAHAGTRTEFRRYAVPTLVLVVVAAYTWSAGPTSRYQLPPGATGDFVVRARDSAAGLTASGPVHVIDSDVPDYVSPTAFAPYNRASRVLGLTVPGLAFDAAGAPYYRFDDLGVLRPVDLAWVESTEPALARNAVVAFRSVEDLTRGRTNACFVTTPESAVIWTLAAPVTGVGLVLRTEATVSRSTPVRLTVLPVGGTQNEAANYDGHELRPGQTAPLETVAAGSLSVVQFRGLDAGVHVCLSALAVGRVAPAG